MKIFGVCLNWKVIAGLGVVAVGIGLFAPNLIGAALPLLIVLACPLSMVFMLRGMGNMGGNMQGDQCGMQGMNIMSSMQVNTSTPQPGQSDLPRAVPLSREARLADLQARLAGTQAEQDVLAREMAALHGTETLDAPVLRQAEAGARAAEEEQMPGAQTGA